MGYNRLRSLILTIFNPEELFLQFATIYRAYENAFACTRSLQNVSRYIDELVIDTSVSCYITDY